MSKLLSILIVVGTITNILNCTQENIVKTMQIRKADYPIDTIFLNRWSSRAMSGEPISDQELNTLFEAARWAPSEYNNQPWRFIYATRASVCWQKFFDLLVPFNQSWCKNAAVLVVLVSKKTLDSGKPSKTHSFDTGAAWQNFALQGSMLGFVVHGMAGFDYEKAKSELGIPDEYMVEVMIAIGKPADVAVLPESLRQHEQPSDRKPLKQVVFEGSFH